MADKDSSFTKENLELLINIGKKLLLDQLKGIVSEIEGYLNPDVCFSNMLKKKYDALIAAGFSKEQAFELALKAVEETLKQTVVKKETEEAQ